MPFSDYLFRYLLGLEWKGFVQQYNPKYQSSWHSHAKEKQSTEGGQDFNYRFWGLKINLGESNFSSKKPDAASDEEQDFLDSLEAIDAVLGHAEERQFTDGSEAVKGWLNKFRSFCHLFEVLFFGHRFELLKPWSKTSDVEADKVRSIFKDLVAEVDRLGLRKGVTWTVDKEFIFSAANSDDIPINYLYGREEDEKSILESMNMLSDHEDGSNTKLISKIGEPGVGKTDGSNTKLISIIGEPGVGKTALVGLIFFNYKVIKSFDFRLWVNIPEGADVCGIANKILETVIEDEDFSPRSDFDDLLTELGKRLEERKFLLVLDSCCIKEDDLDIWERKLLPSLEGAKGSVIILTTRPEFRVPGTHHIRPLRLGLLSTKDCKPLIWKRTSELVDPRIEEDIEVDVPADIASKLGNLPLAAKMIGCLIGCLLPNKTVDEWTEILKNEYLTTRGILGNKDLTIRGQKRRIPSFLALCYLYLPEDLKSCLEYLSIFPKGYEFTQKQVVLMWMAQGFLQDSISSSRSMEEVGNKYFHYLLKRSFFQPLAGGVSFRMHSLVHDFASYAFGESCNHHLSYYGCIEDFPSKHSVQDVHLLKTLLPLGRSGQLQTEELENKISQLNPQMLHVLSLSHHGINDLPPSIGKLSHLHYLDLSHTALVALPDSVCGIATLQTLLLRNCRSLQRFPERMSQLKSLSYLDLSHTRIRELPSSICDLYSLQTLLLTNCGYFTSFPTSTGNLTNLRCLDIRGTKVQEMPLQMNKLTSLQTLTDFIVSENSSNLEDLSGLSNLSTLTVSKLQNAVCPTDASDAKLDEKMNLDDLVLQWSGCRTYGNKDNDYHILENLEPPSGIRRLTVESYGGKSFPSWVGNDSFLNLQSLKLCHCQNCTSLPPVGQLAFLKDLIIEGFNNVSCVGPEFYGNNASDKIFRYLENLEFREMLQWKEWNNSENVEFPCLLKLSIISCPRLVHELPKPKQLPSLEKLEIFGCNDLTTLPETPSTCEVLVDESNETLINSVNKKLPQVTLHRQVLIPGGKKFTLQSYFNASKGKEFQDSFEEQLDTESLDSTDHSKTETSSSDGMETSFEMLRVSDTSELKNLPPRLDGLKIEGCMLPNNLPLGFSTLQELYLVDCSSLKPFPSSRFPCSLRTLYVRNCQNLIEFPSSLNMAQNFGFLEHLCIGSRCDTLQSLTLNFFPKLRTLSIWDCPDLIRLGISNDFEGDLVSLECLEITGCPNLKSFPKGGLLAPNLSSILLSNCGRLKNFWNDKYSLTSLQSLVLKKCQSLESSSLIALPSSLTLLSIVCCDKLTPQESWGLNSLESLTSLEIEGEHITFESFPDEKLLPGNINSLRISTFQSLKKLDYKGFQHLHALQTLEINNCKKLENLPEKGMPSSLIYLCIKGCPLLTSKISSKTAEDWPKVAHIPHLTIIDE